MKTLRVACIQLSASSDVDSNYESAIKWLKKAKRQKAKVAILPEVFLYRGAKANLGEVAKQSKRALSHFKEWAKANRMALILGSLLEETKDPHKFYNTCYVISEKGKLLTKYRKIHLFDINLKKQKVCIQESEYLKAGKDIVTVNLFGFRFGISICYDLRFPELFRALSKRKAEVLVLPSNFTKATGEAHWDSLVRARAIENQCYMLAVNQCGTHPGNGVISFGHSLGVDPWGKVLKSGSLNEENCLIFDLEKKVLASVREILPSLKHRALS